MRVQVRMRFSVDTYIIHSLIHIQRERRRRFRVLRRTEKSQTVRNRSLCARVRMHTEFLRKISGKCSCVPVNRENALHACD